MGEHASRGERAPRFSTASCPIAIFPCVQLTRALLRAGGPLLFARGFARGSALGAALGVLLAGTPAHAQKASLAGSWSAGALVEKVNVGNWVPECGPQPKSSAAGGGGYTVSLSGDELVFSGSPAFRTDRCWDPGWPTLSHSTNPASRSWKTRCESPAGHALKASITTNVAAVDDDTIVLSENATYTSQMQTGSCTATVSRSRVWKRNVPTAPAATPTATPTPSPTGPPPPPPATTPKPTPAYTCASPGEPATLEVRPRRKIIRAGEQFEFHARVLDASGCELAGKPTFKLAPESSASSALTVEPRGLVKAAAAAEPVVATLIVEGAGKSAKVEIEVVSAKKYDELLAASGGDAGMDDQAVAIVVSGGGGGESLVRDPSTEQAGRRRFAWLAIAGGICTLLALAALVVYRKGNEKAARDEEARRATRKPKKIALEPARPLPATPTPQPMGTPLPTPYAGGAPTMPGPGRVCPSCGSSVPHPAEFCPNDGTRLPPATVVTGARPVAQPPPQERGRICPVCGARYEPGAMFCSKDGVSLVPLN